MFSISKISEFGPRRGGRKFAIISEIQNILNYPRGGASLIGNFSQIFPFFFSEGSPKGRVQKKNNGIFHQGSDPTLLNGKNKK